MLHSRILEEDNIYDPFELGERIFTMAQTGDLATADSLSVKLRTIDRKWAEFFRNVVRDYCRSPEEHTNLGSEAGLHHWTGMDHLFHIYLLGWWHAGDDFFDEADKVYVAKHRNVDKALALLPVRFQNCSLQEVGEKLYWDLKHIENDVSPDYRFFVRVLLATEGFIPGAIRELHLAEEHEKFHEQAAD